MVKGRLLVKGEFGRELRNSAYASILIDTTEEDGDISPTIHARSLADCKDMCSPPKSASNSFLLS